MAKNYTFSEAVELIAKGDMEAIQDIGRRFPILAAKVATVSALAGESFVDLASYMPDYLTANKVNRGMRDALAEMEENDDEEENDDVEETKTTKAKAKVEETEDEEEVDYSKMTAKELWDILGEAGKRNTAKSKKKADLVAAVEAMANTEEAEEEDDTDEEETDNPYEGKSAMDLFKECKKRGIKAAAKKPAKFYADLLLKADAEDEGAEEEEEGDDWDVEEEETPKKKPATKSKAKAKKEVEEDDEDEDDDWDI